MFGATRTECVRVPVLSPWFLVVALFTSARAKGLTNDISSIDIGPYANQACCADIETIIGAIERSGFAAIARILELIMALVCTSVGILMCSFRLGFLGNQVGDGSLRSLVPVAPNDRRPEPGGRPENPCKHLFAWRPEHPGPGEYPSPPPRQ